jgi:hypothetical protein
LSGKPVELEGRNLAAFEAKLSKLKAAQPAEAPDEPEPPVS